MAGIAALSMYDFPELRAATDRFWSSIRAELGKQGVDAPCELARGIDVMSVWQDPDLIFSQTCGLPFVEKLSDIAQIIGTPDFGISPQNLGRYNSVIIAAKNDQRTRLSDMKGSRFAFNDKGSQSGLFALMYKLLQENGESRFFSDCLESGSHAQSVAMVADGHADIAAIDAVSWRYIQKYQGCAANVKVIGRTLDAPGLPYICGRSQNASLIADAVQRAIKNLSGPDRQVLGIQGFWRSSASDYQVIAERAAQITNILVNHGFGRNSSAQAAMPAK